ncbi:MAG: hypothetical protein AAFQ35_07155 [Pseudomonadota bacterium]
MKIRTRADHAVHFHGILITPEGTEITDPTMLGKLRDHPQFEVVEERKKKPSQQASDGDHDA